MKQLLPLLLLLSFTAKGQWVEPAEPKEPTPSYHYIIIWRTWQGHMVQRGDAISSEMGWHEDHMGFYDLKELNTWMNITENQWINSSAQETASVHKTTRISENQLIGVYDLYSAKKIKIVFKSEEKSIPRKVVIEADKWTDKSIEIKD